MSPRPTLLGWSVFLAALSFTPFVRAADDVTPAKAAEAKLDSGSKAPEFKPTAWVQGAPVTAFETGKTYLIECWATWCGPCIAQIPHLNALHKKYESKGLVIIGTNVWDKDEANAAKFVKAKGAAMSYRIAFDNKADGQVTRDWLKAAGVNGIPHAFAVRDGVILWHGHPASLDEATLETMLAGKYDVAVESAKLRAAAATEAANKTKLSEAYKSIGEAIVAKDYDLALKRVDEFAALLPEARRSLPVSMAKLRVFAAKKDTAAAADLVRGLLKRTPPDVVLGLNLANAITSQPVFAGDKALAKLAAEAASGAMADANFAKQPGVLMLVAKAQYLAGDKDAALAKLKAIPKPSEDVDARVKKYHATVEKCIAAVTAGEPWPEGAR